MQQVPEPMIANNAITHDKMADNSVGHDEMRDNAVGLDEMRNSAVGTSELIDASVTPAKLSQPLTLETAKASTSGTEVTFTGIPSWVKRITVMLNGVSTSGTSILIVQLGDAGGYETTGYESMFAIAASGGVTYLTATAGIACGGNLAANVYNTIVTFTNVTGNVWLAGISGQLNASGTFFGLFGGGTKTLSALLDSLRITTVNGTDTFDAGSINIMYE